MQLASGVPEVTLVAQMLFAALDNKKMWVELKLV